MSKGFVRVTLLAGTAFTVERGGARERRVLERDTEVGVVWLAFEPGEVGIFRLDDGQVIAVRYEDDVRDERPA